MSRILNAALFYDKILNFYTKGVDNHLKLAYNNILYHNGCVCL